jgi:hypothetical protein
VQVSNDTTAVIDTAVYGIAGIEYRVLGIAHHYDESIAAFNHRGLF